MRALLALLILTAVAPAAQAASYYVPARGATPTLTGATVALAAGQVVWVEERGTGAALVAAGEDGVPRDITTLPRVKGGPRSHSVTASGTTAFLQRHVCADTNCRRDAALDLVRVDLTTGVATPFDGCLGLAACRECSGGYHFGFGLRGDVLGISGRCARDAGVIDLATGETRRVPQRILAAAGRYAVTSPDEQTLIVTDWRTGETIRRLSDVYLTSVIDQVALDADGTLAWSYRAGVNVLAPGAAQPRTVPREPEGLYDVALAAGRLATRTNGGNVEPVTFQVDDRKVDGQRNPYGWAFDGTRLAWAAEPCGNPVIQVWDLAAEPPPPANDRCIRARFADVKLGRKGAVVTVRLSCPATPARGCAGEVAADLFAGNRKVAQTGWWQYRVRPGTTSVERLRVERHGRLRGHKQLVARVKVDNNSFSPTNTRRRVRG